MREIDAYSFWYILLLPTSLLTVCCMLHAECKNVDGKKAGYRSDLLVDSTVDDLEEDVLRDLCNLYEMDVLFMKDLGFATLCDQVLYYE